MFQIPHPTRNPGLATRNRDFHIINSDGKNLMTLCESFRHDFSNRLGINFERVNVEDPLPRFLRKKI